MPARITGGALWHLDSGTADLDDLTLVFRNIGPWVQISFRQSLSNNKGIIQKDDPVESV
jgi:hypothetical protein